jgi:hypothetical protein
VDSFGRNRIRGVYRHKQTFGVKTGDGLPRLDVPGSPEWGTYLSNLACVGEREWWLRAALVLWAPRTVFGAMHADGADARQEPAVTIAFLSGLFAVLSTPRFAGFLDEPEVDGLAVAVFAFVGAAAYAFAGYFVLSAALKLATGAPFGLARHVVAYAAVPLVLGLLVLWPVRSAAHGSDLFRAGGSDGGADGTAFALAELGCALWAVGLLVAGARYALGLAWPRAAAVTVLPVTLAGLAVWLDRFH